MSIITPITGGAGVVPLGALARGHHTVKARALAGEAGEFAGGWAETDLYLPEDIFLDATLDLLLREDWKTYAEPAGLGRGGVFSTPGAAFTISRPAPRSYVDSDGVLKYTASGAIARDFTPAGAARGLQIEPQTTNLATYSEDFSNAVWQKFSSSASANAAVAPDGATTGDKFVEAAATAIHYWARTHTIVAGTLHTWTVFAKAAGRTYLQLFVDNGAAVGAHATFDLSAGTVTQSLQLGGAVGLVSSIEDAGNGWWRLRLTTYIGAGSTSLRAGFVLVTTSTPGFAPSYAGDGTSGVYLWGAQLEALGVPTSYMPAGASSAVRYADGVSTSIAGLIGAAEGGLYIDCQPIDSSAVQILAQIDDGTNSNKVLVHRWSDDVIYAEIYTAGVSQGSLTLGAHTGGDLVKVALGWAANSFAGRKSGGSLQTDASVTPPSGLTTLRLGSGVSIASPLNGHLRRVAAYPTRAIMTNTKIGELVA